MSGLRVYLDSLGCRLNQAEIEDLAGQLRAAGHRLVPSVEAADWAVLNSCAVTGKAARDSRARLLRLHRLAPHVRIAVTGCWSTVDPAAAAGLDGVALVVPNRDKRHLAGKLLGAEQAGVEPPAAHARVPGPRRRARAFLAVQDGCDRACSYCLTTIARGPSRSSALDLVLARAQAAEAAGVGELVLCGVQLSSWGRDLPGSPSLADLLDALLVGTDSSRIRLSSVEPWGLPDGLFERWRDPRLCPSLHLPLQAGCDVTLARMARPYRRAQAQAVISEARRHIPDLALSTDLLVGFPGETEAEHSETLAWVRGLALADVHVFTFSPRPGTRAAGMPDPVPRPVARQRRQRILGAVAPARQAYHRALLGCEATALWVAAQRAGDGWDLRGVTEHGVQVLAHSPQDLWAQRSLVRLEALEGEGIRASFR